MADVLEETPVVRKRGRMARVTAATLVGVGTIMAGGGVSFAGEPPETDPPSEVAGEALGALVDQGTSFVSTYVFPAAITAMGIGFLLAMFRRFGKQIRSWF